MTYSFVAENVNFNSNRECDEHVEHISVFNSNNIQYNRYLYAQCHIITRTAIWKYQINKPIGNKTVPRIPSPI